MNISFLFRNKIKTIRIAIFIGAFLVTFFGGVEESEAATYYVDKENRFGNVCSNAGVGTIAQPKCDFNHDWFMRNLEPGDEVIVREAPTLGYGEVRLYGTSAGTSQDPVVIEAYIGEHINLKAGLQFGVRLLDDVSNVTFKDLDITNREYSFASGSSLPHHNIKLQDCNIYNTDHGPRLFDFHDSEIRNCEIHDLAVNGVQLNNGSTNIIFDSVNVYRVSDGRAPVNSDADGFHTYGGEDILINNCTSHDNSEDGFDMNANVTITNSKSYNNKGAGLKIWRRVNDDWASKTAIVANSLFYNNGYYEPDPLDGNPGIKISDGAKLEMYNSVVFGNYDQGVKIRWAADDGSYLADKIYPTSIIKNTIIAATVDGPGLEDTYRCTADVRNLQENPRCTSISRLTTESNNLYFDNFGGDAKAYNLSGVYGNFSTTNAIFSDPIFSDSAGGDFHIGSGSEAIDSGLDLTALGITSLLSDLDNISRPQNSLWDIGAYEYTTSGSDTTAPGSPSGLSVQ